MDSLRFADPLWLLGWLVLPVLVWRQLVHGRRLRGSIRFSHLGGLDLPVGGWARLRPLLFAGRIVGLACLVTAMARPQSGEEIVDVAADGVDIMLVLDVSSSMQARDLGSANRLQVAREVVARFIDGRHSDRIGMVVFAGESFTQCPLTLDYDVLLQFLGEIRIAEESWDGTAIGMAMINAVNRLRDTAGRAATGSGAAGSRVAILLTDGVNNAGEIDPATAADVAAAVDVRFYTIGVGAVQRGLRRRGGVDFDEEVLRQIAGVTGGQYYHATSSEKLAEIYEEIGRLETTEVTSRIHLEFSERYASFLWLGLFVLLAEYVLRQTRLRTLP
ncbi:MAG TPA: VWA domain-containing protein [Candidatus Latescibacteria bacterium]|jgi:Ca-activated chloride channel family protein|nr:aerotolerance regulator BatA [Gemmatimonadaceae bacterium]MDP6016538.1 VWA domain-containing protein [Candidatus Latescibacterota bacterium]HJP30311.1 VWA domain-containing protein [Candidatus Latescibacterota bacterium]